MHSELESKYLLLQDRLRELPPAAVAFSGGADSTLLLEAAYRMLGDEVLALTAQVGSQPDSDRDFTESFCRSRSIQRISFPLNEMDIPGFAGNPPERCYLCKRQMFRKIKELAAEQGVQNVLDGTNADDLLQDRPGRRALEELGVICPLAECGFTKDDVRELSHELGLPTWDKPSDSCLYTRVAFGETLTPEKLHLVRSVEEALAPLGFKKVRARLSGDSVNVEISTR